MPEKKPLRAAIYARVSTATQKLDPQLADLHFYIARRCWNLQSEYIDVGTGLAVQHELARMLEAGWKREFDVLIVGTLDGLGRNLREISDRVLALSKCGIQVIACQDHFEFDPTTHDGNVRLEMLAWIAKSEERRLSANIKMGQRAARACGKHIGRVPLEVNEEKVQADYQRLKSLRAVARRHGCSTWLISEILKERRGFSGETGGFSVRPRISPGKPGKTLPGKNRNDKT